MKTITIANQKGGVGKSTTAHALIDGLTRRGFTVLAIDLDGQTNLTSYTGVGQGAGTIFGVLTGESKIERTIVKTRYGDIVPASPLLKRADSLIDNADTLRQALEPVKQNYDFIIIDTPPQLSALTLNALVCSDYVIIPAQPSLFSMQGIKDLQKTIEAVRTSTNKGLKVLGVLLTRTNGRATLHNDFKSVLEPLLRDLETSLFNSTIRNAVAVEEAPFFKGSIYEYAPKSKVTEDYEAFIDEVIGRIKKQ